MNILFVLAFFDVGAKDTAVTLFVLIPEVTSSCQCILEILQSEHAEQACSMKILFSEHSRHIPKFYKAVGETLSTGLIDGNDGLITEEGKHTHFDLFEFESCNLSNKFTPIEKLI